MTRGSEYSTIEVDTGQSLATYYKSVSGDNICFEIDVMTTQATNKGLITWRKVTTVQGSFALSEFNLSANTWYHFKIELKDKMYVYVDGVAQTPKNYTNDYDKFCIHCLKEGATNPTTNFKNFMIYEI